MHTNQLCASTAQQSYFTAQKGWDQSMLKIQPTSLWRLSLRSSVFCSLNTIGQFVTSNHRGATAWCSSMLTSRLSVWCRCRKLITHGLGGPSVKWFHQTCRVVSQRSSTVPSWTSLARARGQQATWDCRPGLVDGVFVGLYVSGHMQ